MKFYRVPLDRTAQCGHCHTQVDVVLHRFCPSCGTVVLFCYNCKYQMEQSEKYCAICGAESLSKMPISRQAKIQLIAESANGICPHGHVRRVCRGCGYHWFIDKREQGINSFAASAAGLAFALAALSGKRKSGRVKEGKKMDKYLSQIEKMAVCPHCRLSQSYDEFAG